MSYVRFAWDGSEVYMFEHCAGGIQCCGCRFVKLGEAFPSFGTPEEAIAHLGLHRRAGHFVPEYAITGLWNDIPGCDKPTRPEPKSLTKMKKMIQKARKDLQKEERKGGKKLCQLARQKQKK